MLSQMLQINNIKIVDQIDDWKDAVYISLKPLEDGGYVEKRYADEIIKTTEEIGPYYVLAEDIALIHGRPEQGVLKKQIAITLVKKPVIFSEDSFPVRILIALAATDANSHLDIMQLLASIFMDDNKIKTFAECNSPEEIYDFLLKEEQERRESVC